MRVAITIMCLLLAACDVPGMDSNGGTGPKRTYAVSAFSGLTLAGDHDVVVTQGATQAVRAEGDPKTLDRLSVRVEDGELWIGEGGREITKTPQKTVVYVTVPTLDSVTIGGSGDVHITKMEGDSFQGTIGGSGDLEVEALSVRDAEFTIAGQGDLKLSGRAQTSKFRIAGSGDVKGDAFASKTAAISIAGSGSVTIQATDEASISIVGSGDARIKGTAKCSISKLGIGKAKCGP